MSMRVRDLQQYLEKFTMGVKGTGVSDARVYIETQDGHLEEIRKMEVQDSKLLKASEPIRLVFKTETNEVVAEYKGKIPPDRFAELLDQYGRKYNNALMCPENNSYGYATVLKLKELNYPTMYYRKRKSIYIGNYVPSNSNDIAGFTTSGKSRNLILSKLEEVIRNKTIKIYSSRFYDELKTFIWKGQKAQAMKGYNDDLVMSLAIGMWIFDTSSEHSHDSSMINQAMLQGMSKRSTKYDDLPSAITEGNPPNNNRRASNADPGAKKSEGSSSWKKSMNISKEYDWLFK